jgi:cyanoexosortase A
MTSQLQQVKQQIKRLFEHKLFWVLANLSCFATLHIYCFWKISDKTPSLINLLGWGSIGFLLWNKRHKFKIRGDIVSSILGLILIVWMLVRHILIQSQLSFNVLSYFFPLITVTGLLLIFTGFSKLRNYISELVIATLISLPFGSIYTLLKPIVNIDAQLLNFNLHYLGFTAFRQGAVVSLTNGSVEVMGSCSSVSPILTMIPFVIVLLSIYPTSKIKQFFVYLSTICSIIFVNSIRLSVLAIFIDKKDLVNFNYWHTGGGAGIFSNMIVFLIAGISYQIINHSSKSTQQELKIEN